MAGEDPASQLIVVSCYTCFDHLAHMPQGTEAQRSLYTFRLDPSDGQMTLLAVTRDHVTNPAFSRFHASKNILYTCTEAATEPGDIATWKVCPRTGSLTQISTANAGGTSNCHLTLDWGCQNMLVVNSWNATIAVFGLDTSTGLVTALRSSCGPSLGLPTRGIPNMQVNLCHDGAVQQEDQGDRHSHAVVLDTHLGRIAFVPDLGMDLIRQFLYDPDAGLLTPCGNTRSGPEDQRVPLGPSYIEFSPTLPVCYVVNELSSEVSVFRFEKEVAVELVRGGATGAAARSGKRSLHLIQTISAIPDAFPAEENTCGRIAVHAGGNFVLVSNRGHDSLTVFRVHHEGPQPGLLSAACIQHTRGTTPRHFQFDASGQWLVTANQDSDRIGVFHFNLATGRLDWTGHEYEVPSPNFVCCVQPHPEAHELVPPSSRL